LLCKIHTSEELLRMLHQMKKEVELPRNLLVKMRMKLSEQIFLQPIVQKGLRFLEDSLPEVPNDALVVCHGDINHHNFLKNKEDKLYLVDWDGAVVADCAMDIGILLYHYIPMGN